MKKNLIISLAVVTLMATFGTACTREKEIRIVHVTEKGELISEETVEEKEYEANLAPTAVYEAHEINPTHNAEYAALEYNNEKHETPETCRYCSGTGESYLGQVTPLIHRDITQPWLYICKVCEGEKTINPSEAEKKVKAMEKVYGPNWLLM